MLNQQLSGFVENSSLQCFPHPQFARLDGHLHVLNKFAQYIFIALVSVSVLTAVSLPVFAHENCQTSLQKFYFSGIAVQGLLTGFPQWLF
jgi:hypothetical protein